MSFSPAPLDLDQVLNCEWLSEALSQGCGRTDVSSFKVVETLGPSALKIRLALDFASPPSADVPSQICIKGIFDPKLSLWLTSGGQQAESLFYREVAPAISVRVPRALYSGFDPSTMAGVIVMEDLVPQGVRFLSANSPYTLGQTLKSLDQLARLHGASWGSRYAGLTWAASKLSFLAGGAVMPAARLTELMHDGRAEAVPEAIRSGERIYAALGALARRDAETQGLCLVHGDCHAGNVWQTADGEIGFVDWQVLQRSHWSIDVAYHIAAALDIETRRASELELLSHYLDRLQAHGGPALDPAAAWDEYRKGAAYGLFMWGITQRVEPAIVLQFATRLGVAVADHGSFEALGV